MCIVYIYIRTYPRFTIHSHSTFLLYPKNHDSPGAPLDGHLAAKQLVAGIQRVEYGSLGEDLGVVGVRRWGMPRGTWKSHGKKKIYIYMYRNIELLCL